MTVRSTGAPASNAELIKRMRREADDGDDWANEFLLDERYGSEEQLRSITVCLREAASALERADARERALLEPSDEVLTVALRAYDQLAPDDKGRFDAADKASMRAAIIAANRAILQAKTEATE